MDKIQLIKEEIERRIENLKISLDKNCVTEESKLDIRGNITTLYGLLDFIGSLPEEPKKQPKFRVGDTIKGPCNNVFQVKEVLDTQYLLHSENGDELNSIEIVDKYSCISEEPVSEDLEETARYYLLNNHVSPLNDILHQADLKVEMQYHKDIENAYKVGAEWQKQQMMKDALDGCVTMIVKSDTSSRNLFISTSQLYKELQKYEEGDKLKIIIVKED